jgi:hypothetical protein
MEWHSETPQLGQDADKMTSYFSFLHLQSYHKSSSKSILIKSFKSIPAWYSSWSYILSFWFLG